eukprot:c3558_g1_i1.p1 GENE.c3558_g1_i1~~c3558_g1_i1.p1  ORF type:complete len:181 (-),score=32.74 c3558_g1_i1:191-733(-)
MLVLVGLLGLLQAYKELDVVPVRVRLQSAGHRSDPFELEHSLCPRFLRFGSHTINQYHTMWPDLTDVQDLKMQILVDHDQFATPWITVHEPGAALQVLVIFLEVHGDDIQSIRYQPFYSNIAADAAVVPIVNLVYRFESHTVETSHEPALWLLFGTAMLTNAALIAMNMFGPNSVMISNS